MKSFPLWFQYFGLFQGLPTGVKSPFFAFLSYAVQFFPYEAGLINPATFGSESRIHRFFLSTYPPTSTSHYQSFP